ncbi:hypothetical protein PG984_010209 [Apiospora sp. TS-2023a]
MSILPTMAAAQDNTMMPSTSSEPTTPVVASRLLRLFRIAELRNNIFDSLSATETSLMCALLDIQLPDFERKKYINPLRELGHVGDAIRQLKDEAGIETTLVGAELEHMAAGMREPLLCEAFIGGLSTPHVVIALHFSGVHSDEHGRALMMFYRLILGVGEGAVRRRPNVGGSSFGEVYISTYFSLEPVSTSVTVGDVCIVLPENLASPFSDLRDVPSASCPSHLPSTGKKQRKRDACLELQTLKKYDNQHVVIDDNVRCTFYIADHLRSLYPSLDLGTAGWST